MDAQTDHTTAIHGHEREGFALAATILALVVVGAIVTAGFYAASQETRISTGMSQSGQALYFAEHGLSQVLGNMTRAELDTLPRDTFIVAESGTVEGGNSEGQYVAEVRRMGLRLWLIRSQGTVLSGGRYAGATRDVGLMVRVLDMAVPMDRAMQIHEGLEVGGNATISGEDESPNNWGNCVEREDQKGIVARDTTEIDTHGNAHDIEGDPPIAEDPDMNDDDFFEYGDMDFDDLASWAQKVYPHGAEVQNTGPAVQDGVCDKTVQSNWGAPEDDDNPCHYYFPIIYAEGDLELSSASAGQGILLVEGNLTVRGGFRFYGIIIVRGAVDIAGTGDLYGMVMVRGGGTVDASETTGNSLVNYSSCAIERARKYNERLSRPIPIAGRSWHDLSLANVDF